jgi:hypothetical protein
VYLHLYKSEKEKNGIGIFEHNAAENRLFAK